MADNMKDEMKQLINSLLKYYWVSCGNLTCEECPLSSSEVEGINVCRMLMKISVELDKDGVKPMNCSSVRCVECGQCKPVYKETTPGTTFERAVKAFGGYNQMIKTTEEMSELTKELCKAVIGQEDRKHILEELTDVEIMLKQMKLVFEFTEDELMEMKVLKIAKLEMLLDQQDKNGLLQTTNEDEVNEDELKSKITELSSKLDWKMVHVDTPVMVRDYYHHEELFRYYARYDELTPNAPYSCFAYKHKASNSSGTVNWRYCRLATQEEIERHSM